jgi:hypothetical protein
MWKKRYLIFVMFIVFGVIYGYACAIHINKTTPQSTTDISYIMDY